ncbi:MAG: SCO1664 family protein [bacterium]|nr:SCO1664 family protein [bacterium]MCP4964716.1 SCO1664 family protein [bacterium]
MIFVPTVRDPMTVPWQPVVADVVGRFVDASNATLLATTTEGVKVVYKPTAGERPLWDFTVESLAAREALTYEVAVALGYDIVPETVLGDGPYGPGAIQRFVDIAPDFDPIAVVESGSADLWPIAILDIVTNNADRKLGHLISDGDRLLGIDHGLTFHPEEKLRTVLWQFSGVPLPAAELAALERLETAVTGSLGTRVEEMLGVEELRSLCVRIESLIDDRVHPDPPDDRPPLPWPPY